jgi:hypothetical protein
MTDRRIGAGGGHAAVAIIRYHDEDDWRMPTGLKWPQTGNSGLSISSRHSGWTELCNRAGAGAFLLSLRLNRKSCPDTLHCIQKNKRKSKRKNRKRKIKNRKPKRKIRKSRG